MRINLNFGQVKAVVDTFGAELISFQDANGKEYIWNGNPEFWSGRNPNLFPVVGNLKDGKIMINGNEYKMGRHGFARGSEFSVAEQGENYVVFELTENDETMNVYPFKFSFKVIHRLEENGFSTEYKVTNTGAEMLPYCVGAHTAFNCPMNEGEVFEDYQLVFNKEEDAETHLLTSAGVFQNGDTEPMLHGGILPLDYSVYERLDTVVFRGLKSTEVCLKHKESGHGVKMEFEQFPMIAFWTKGKERAPFICVEPWHGCAAFENESGIFEDKEFCIQLEPDQNVELSYMVKII